MEAQINSVLHQLFMVFLEIAVPLAILRLGVSGIKSISGDKEAVPVALRQVGVGLFVILTARTVVFFIEGFSRAVSVVGP